MRQIKASEIKPGMTIRWGCGDVSFQCPIVRVELFNDGQDIQGETPQGQVALLHGDEDVLVVKEPPQPEEPTELGVKARVREGRFLRLREGLEGSNVWFEEGTGYRWTWDDLCEMGPVTVIPDQGWTVPDTPEAPERIDEWDTWEDVPEGVTVANPELNYQYRKASDKIETISPISGGVWGETSLPLWTYPGPWERVSDA